MSLPAGPPVDGLALSLVLAPTTAPVGAVVVATVTLFNSGRTARRVNARLAINGPHAPEPFRDVVFAIEGPDAGETGALSSNTVKLELR